MHVEKSASETEAKNQTSVLRKSDRELVITRTFNGPATMVFDAWTKPELVMRWWAPKSKGMKLVSCEIDLRVGGKYRYVFERDGQKIFEAFGKYTLVERPMRLAWTDEDQLVGRATGEASSSLTLEEKDGKTKLIYYSLFPSKEAFEAIASGMEIGTRETLDQLEELLASSKTNA